MHRAMIGLLLFTASAFGQDAKPNLTGTWQYAPTPMARDREIDRIEITGPEVAISEKVGRADVIFTLYYRTDGKPPREDRFNAHTERTGHWEGQTLVLDTRFVPERMGSTTRHEEVSLSSYGKTLTKKVHCEGSKPQPDQVIEFTKIAPGVNGIKPGDSEAVVRKEWGDPVTVEHRGDKTIYVYDQQLGPFEVIFVDGKMTNSMFRKFDKEAIGNAK
jgi:hypothetical protein